MKKRPPARETTTDNDQQEDNQATNEGRNPWRLSETSQQGRRQRQKHDNRPAGTPTRISPRQRQTSNHQGGDTHAPRPNDKQGSRQPTEQKQTARQATKGVSTSHEHTHHGGESHAPTNTHPAGRPERTRQTSHAQGSRTQTRQPPRLTETPQKRTNTSETIKTPPKERKQQEEGKE